MKTPPILGLLVSVLMAGAGCAQGAAGDGSSGVQGRVTIGPQCPVMQVGSPCPDAPSVATVRVLLNGDEVASGRSDEDGSFRIPVAPGDYTVEAVPVEQTGIVTTASQPRVVVTAGRYTRVDLSLDSGIR
ncbi:MAG: carboxypeptidase-like regulatory domain-containing protein [Actinomycetota bacterium]